MAFKYYDHQSKIQSFYLLPSVHVHVLVSYTFGEFVDVCKSNVSNHKISFKQLSKIHLSNYLLTCGIRNRTYKASSTLQLTISG